MQLDGEYAGRLAHFGESLPELKRSGCTETKVFRHAKPDPRNFNESATLRRFTLTRFLDRVLIVQFLTNGGVTPLTPAAASASLGARFVGVDSGRPGVGVEVVAAEGQTSGGG
jgi:hypothetical protein